MKINWHTLVGGLAAVVAWVVANVNVGALPGSLGHEAVVVVGILGTVLATFSKPAVQAAAVQANTGGK